MTAAQATGDVSTTEPFYGADQAHIHDTRFGDLARGAAAFLLAELGRAGLDRGTVVDLGCGSGILAAAVTGAGYAVEGVDLSASMVALARAAAPAAVVRQGSLHDAVVAPGTVAVTAIGEALNYATDGRAGRAALADMTARVARGLAPGGLFLFDVATPGRGSRMSFHDHPDWCLGMEATESADGTRLDRHITIFAAEPAEGPGPDGHRYRRTHEHHVLHLYRPEELVELLGSCGLEAELRPDYGVAGPSVPAAGWTVVVGRRPAG